MTDMHRCLQISEIFYNILENLSQSGLTRRDLLAVALVSKDFCEPALDVLWLSQGSFAVLIKTFPPDLWTENGDPKKLIFQRILTQSDFDRYLFYGKKMRKLSVTDQNSLSRIDWSVFLAISISLDRFYPDHVVMSHLREFYCSHDQLDSLWEIIPYLSPSLQEAKVDIGDVERGLPALAFFTTLAVKSPFVKKIGIYHRNPYDSSTITAPISSKFPCGFLHLSAFECPHFPINCIGHLAHLPNLGHLSLWFSDPNASNMSMPAVTAQPFPSLRELTLNGTRFTSGIEFIQTYLPSVSLESITVFADNAPSAGEICQVFSALSSHLSLPTLTSISVYNDMREEYDHGPVLESSDFEPLLRFNNLESLTLAVAFSPEHISDSILEAISLAWPRLKTLDLESYLPFVPPSQCTFDGLLHLAERCPRLFDLSIPFTASSKFEWNGRSGVVPFNRSLKNLDVGRSPIDDVGMVTSLLLDIFPNIERIMMWDPDFYDTSSDEDGQNHHRWQKVIEQYMANKC